MVYDEDIIQCVYIVLRLTCTLDRGLFTSQEINILINNKLSEK